MLRPRSHREYGSESSATLDRPSRTLAAPLAWSLSIVAHLGILVFAFMITWSVVRTPADRPIVVVAAPGARPEYRPVKMTQQSRMSAPIPDSMQRRSEVEPASSDDIRSLLAGDLEVPEDARPAADLDSMPLPSISFGGVKGPMAERIALVVDASGSMIGAFPAVVDEIERTLRAMDSRQTYEVLVFLGGGVAGEPGVDRGMKAATIRSIDRTMDWLDDLTPEGRSDPSVALRRAFKSDPEIVYLISTDLTGQGIHEVDRKSLFRLLESLNPADARGRRRSTIRCVQLLDEERVDTLREIARRHRASEDSEPGFAFISRKALGLD